MRPAPQECRGNSDQSLWPNSRRADRNRRRRHLEPARDHLGHRACQQSADGAAGGNVQLVEDGKLEPAWCSSVTQPKNASIRSGCRPWALISEPTAWSFRRARAVSSACCSTRRASARRVPARESGNGGGFPDLGGVGNNFRGVWPVFERRPAAIHTVGFSCGDIP
jgi:hypothetical protein